MRTPRLIASTCVVVLLQLLLSIQPVSGHGIKPRATIISKSVLTGIANSLIGGQRAIGDQSLSLNMSNLVLMLVLRGLIWGISYVQNGSGSKDARNDGVSLAPSERFIRNLLTETDVMLFLGYLVADRSGHYDCLNRVACEQPNRADDYRRSADMIWKIAKIFNGVQLDTKYQKILNRMQEAVEHCRAYGDCHSKYRCFDSNLTTAYNFNFT